MIKTALIISAALIGNVAASVQLSDTDTAPEIAEQTMIPLPRTESVIAQFSYIELIHDSEGLRFSVTDKTAAFVDLEFSGDLHIRIGF